MSVLSDLPARIVFLCLVACLFPVDAITSRRHAVPISVQLDATGGSCYYNIFLTNYAETGFGGALVTAQLDGATVDGFSGITLPANLEVSGWKLPVTSGSKLTISYDPNGSTYGNNALIVTDANGKKLVNEIMTSESKTFEIGLIGCECVYSSECPATRVRNEWRSLSFCDKQLFINALNEFRYLNDSDGHNLYEKFILHHEGISSDVVKGRFFLPWHRGFTLKLETFLRSMGGIYTCLAMPYWDASLDFGNEISSDVFHDLGGVLEKSCIGEPFAHWTDPLNYLSEWGHSCVSRRVYPDIQTFEQFPSATAFDLSVVGNRNYEWLFRYLVRNPHKSVHTFVAGSMATLHSPADPLFFLHHANIDRLYATWQDCWDFDTDQFPPSTQFQFIWGVSKGDHQLDWSMPALFPDMNDHVDDVVSVLDMLNISRWGYTYPPMTRTLYRMNESYPLDARETCNWGWLNQQAQDEAELWYRLPVHNDEQRLRLSSSRAAFTTHLSGKSLDVYGAYKEQLNVECLLNGGYNATDFNSVFMSEADSDPAIGPGDMFKNACKLLLEPGHLDTLLHKCVPDFSC